MLGQWISTTTPTSRNSIQDISSYRVWNRSINQSSFLLLTVTTSTSSSFSPTPSRKHTLVMTPQYLYQHQHASNHFPFRRTTSPAPQHLRAAKKKTHNSHKRNIPPPHRIPLPSHQIHTHPPFTSSSTTHHVFIPCLQPLPQ